ncbi:MAG: hypothetical protein U0694_15315 [Anaerolineae bacterium]
MNATQAGDYFAILAFAAPSEELTAAMNDIRRRLRHVTHRAVSIGYGPRYLHSTGQLHKGGPTNGIFIELTMDDAEDVAIPGEPFSFGVLKAAQAAGDFEALQGKGRRAFRLHGKPADTLARLSEAIDKASERRH